MARGKNIIVNSEAKGRFIEGALATGFTPKPGTILQIKGSSGIDSNGRFTFQLYDRAADGDRPAGPLCVLLDNWLEGRDELTAYGDSKAVRCYIPMPGDEFNLLMADVAGTADDHPVGELMMVDDGTGKLIASTGSPQSTPFMLLETITDPAADQLVHVIFSGF